MRGLKIILLDSIQLKVFENWSKESAVIKVTHKYNPYVRL